MRKTVAVALMVVAVVSCRRGEQKVAQTGTAATTQTTQTAARGSSGPAAVGNDVGMMMPEYTAVNLDGSKFDLAAKRNKVVLLNVWATWCGPCRYEIPELQKIHEHYAPRGFEVIGASVDETDVESVRSFIAEQKKMTYPIVHDPDGKITALLETGVLPTSVLVDRTGKIVWRKIGAIMEGDEELKQVIESAVGG
ncbi:MAG TPA: TlpA disulfide reductase family protein [Thermoanaerobaculia bacterium]|nr:TlpA disulfide reductase family protein [Thermoanaerobaculia bacterium]